MVRLAHHSTALEGNTISLQDTVSVLLYNTIPNQVNLCEFYEVDNHREAFDYIINQVQNDKPLTVNTIKEEIQELINKMEQSVESYYESPEEMREYLLFMSRFHQYSLGNVSLIQNQFSGAQAVGSFKFWKEQGYSVNKGEKGMKILVPQQVQAKFLSEDGTWKLIKDASDKEKELITQKN